MTYAASGAQRIPLQHARSGPRQWRSTAAVGQAGNVATVKGFVALTLSKQRVTNHSRVSTTGWMAENMLALGKVECERFGSGVIPPACGSGNVLIPVLACKLVTARGRHGRSEF